MNNSVFRNLSYGVYVVSTLDGSRPTGCTANSIMQITSSPATLAISINHDNYTNSCIQKSGKFAVSVLPEDISPELIGQFGFQSGKDINKFDGTSFEYHNEMPVLTDSCCYMVCKVLSTTETSTHTVFIGEVIDGDVFVEKSAMTYSYYHTVVKGKSPKNAPSYVPDEDEKSTEPQSTAYQCSICGHIYKGDTPFDELPDTFICPICKQPKNMFKQV